MNDKVTDLLFKTYKIRALRSLGSPVSFALYVIGSVLIYNSNLCAQYDPNSYPQNQPSLSQSANAPPTVTVPTGVYVQTHIDPYTGRQIDTYLEHETVPVLRWEQQEVTERRYVPQWVNETQKTTEVQYVPTVTYQTQARNLNAWNPLLPQRIAYEYIPVTQYQVVNQVIDKPITYQKYVDQEFKVVVPKLVQVTEQRAKYTQRERNANGAMLPSSQGAVTSPVARSALPTSSLSAEQQSAQLALANRNSLGTNYVTRPVQGWGNVGYAGNTYPYSPYANVVATPSFNPYANSYASASMSSQNYASYLGNSPSSTPRFTTVSYQQPNAIFPNQNPSALTNNYFAQNQSYNQSWFQMPNWLKGNGPLFNQSLLRPATYPNYNANSGYLASNYLPSMFNNQSYPQTSYSNPNYSNQIGYSNQTGYSNNSVAGASYGYSPTTSTVASIRPSSAPVLPSTNPYGGRDAIQAGLPPSVLR